ncbi:PKHG4-like protein [Mya arenaria]|uniref:PKHG4-like protein n=1 Tax=Mya arenaria TaxID=6604 RepID=A0ABY7EPX3_MYAAR|nr:PKHG4-like protein [Mya arenaria]
MITAGIELEAIMSHHEKGSQLGIEPGAIMRRDHSWQEQSWAIQNADNSRLIQEIYVEPAEPSKATVGDDSDLGGTCLKTSTPKVVNDSCSFCSLFKKSGIPGRKSNLSDCDAKIICDKLNNTAQSVELWVKHCSVGGDVQRKFFVPKAEFGGVFSMSWRGEEDRGWGGEEDRGWGREEGGSGWGEDGIGDQGLEASLRRCLANLEDSVCRLRWQGVTPTPPHNMRPSNSGAGDRLATGQGRADQYQGESSESTCPRQHCRRSSNHHNNGHVTVDGREGDRPPRSPGGLHQHRQLDTPRTILDVDYTLLQSGIAILPGSQDGAGNALVLVFTSSSLWKNQQVRSTDLARLLMYYHTVPRATYVEINLLLSPGLLASYISPNQLLPAMDGTLQYSHEDWLRFHMRLDPFMSSCRSVGQFLVGVLEELSGVERVPSSAQEAESLVRRQEKLVAGVWQDSRVTRLHGEGEATLQALQRDHTSIAHTEDYRYSMEDVTRLFRHVQDTLSRLLRLSDTRMARLETCLQLRDFEEECSKSHIEKGNDLLEDAGCLARAGHLEEVTGYKELATMLKRQLQTFSERLEEVRERIGATTKCYQLLDKTYEWALESMKYVASMKMELCASPEGLEKLLHSLEIYLQEHPPVGHESFSQMADLAQQLHNDKLLEQCQTAQNRCIETQKMLELRATTLQQFHSQLEQDKAGYTTKMSAAFNKDSGQRVTYDLSKYFPHSSPSPKKTNASAAASPAHSSDSSISPAHRAGQWEPKDSSTPVVPKTYSRTQLERLRSLSSQSPSSSSTSSPVHAQTSLSPRSPSHASLIHPVYASPTHLSYPASPSNSSQDASVTNSNRTDTSDSSSSSDRLKASESDNVNASSNTSPQKSWNMRRAISVPGAGSPRSEDGGGNEESKSDRVASLRQDGRTNSMITGSSDSLPSLPEEEDEGVISGAPRELAPYFRREWTPVPVNSHLTDTSTPVTPLEDLKLTLSLIMSEMIQTERDYVCALQFIVEQYVPEMLREDGPQQLRGKRNESQFHLYALYNKNKPKSDILMAEYGKAFFKEKQTSLGDKMDLASYLLKPVQRMGKYALLLKQVVKECPRDAPESHDLRAAEDMVRFQLRHGNDLLAMDSLRDCDVNLQEQGRLLRQDEFLVYHGRRKFMRHVFLFEDLVLFSKTRHTRSGFQDTYLYKFSFKMSDIGLTQDYEGSGYKFELWWRRRNSGERYVLQAASSEQKKLWVKDLTRVLWNQAVKNRENHLSELATMGIGNKPCMDIKPSSDNIQDRFINIAVGSRDARNRNSIAVCSSEHHQKGKSGIGTSITSGGEADTTLKCETSDMYRAQSPPPYDFRSPPPPGDREFGKPRLINLPSHAEEATDV